LQNLNSRNFDYSCMDHAYILCDFFRALLIADRGAVRNAQKMIA
jgi:hypothetical protein